MDIAKIKELISDIQTGRGKIWDMKNGFPESMRGSMAKQLWHDPKFNYGIEYGALILLNHLLEAEGQ